MRIYERYLARRLYQTFAFVLFCLLGLLFCFDLISESDLIGRANYKLSYALVRVALLIPSHFYEVIPIATLISAIYVFATMAAYSEYTVLRISGLSVQRALCSLTKIGIPLIAITFLLGEMVTPYAEQLSERIRLKALGSTVSSNFQSGVWVKDTLANDGQGHQVTRFVNVGELKPDTTVRKVRIYEFDSQFRLISIRTAQSGQFVPPDHWRLTGVSMMRLLDLSNAKHAVNPAHLNNRINQAGTLQNVQNAYRSNQTTVGEYLIRSQLTPQILSVLLVSPDRMSIINLFLYIQHLQENYQDTQRYKIALWRKFTYPFAILVVLTLSLPFAYLHTRAGAVSIKVFGGIMLGMSFQLLNTLFSHIGTLKTWPAPLAAATPALLYLALSIVALRWVNR